MATQNSKKINIKYRAVSLSGEARDSRFADDRSVVFPLSNYDENVDQWLEDGGWAEDKDIIVYWQELESK